MKNYFGIDLGDGETSAACIYGNDLTSENTYDPDVLTLANKQSIISVVGTKAGMSVVGDNALTGGRAVSDIQSRFKSKYLSDRIESKRNVYRFAKGIYELMKDKLRLGEHDIALGCPAGWSESDRIEYAQLAIDAGFMHVHPVAESRAAFLFAHYSKGLSQESLKRSTLVIDFGSSTIDFAYIVDGKQNNAGVFGVDLGGGMLDRCIYDEAVGGSRKNYSRDAFKEAVENPTWRNLGEIRARESKEKYFNTDGKVPIKYVFSIFKNASAPVVLNFELNQESMNRILDIKLHELNGRSFRKGLYDALNEAKEKTKEKPPEILLLTGGASQMQFFKDACAEIFPNAHLLPDSEPALSISKGLAIAAYIDSGLSVFRTEVAEYLKSGKIENALSSNIPSLMTELRPLLQSLIFEECVMPAVRRMKPRASAQEFEEAILDNSSMVFNDQEKLKDVNGKILKWISRTLNDRGIKDELFDLCDKFRVDRPDLIPDSITGDLIHISDVSPRLPFLIVCKVIAAGIDLELLKRFAERLIRDKVIKAIDNATGLNGEFAPKLASDLAVEISARINDNAGKVEILI